MTEVSDSTIRWEQRASAPLGPGILGQAVVGEHLSVARFELAPGAEVPSHAHDSEEVGHVLAGALKVAWADQESIVRAGESFLIPGGASHRAVALDEGCTLLECYSPPRDPTAAAAAKDGAA